MYQTIRFFWIVFLILCLYRCYHYVGLKAYSPFMGAGALFMYAYMSLEGSKAMFRNSYKIEFFIILATLMSFMISILLFDSGIKVVLMYLLPLSFIPYFYLVQKNVGIVIVERVLVFFAFTYLICWLYQISQVPIIVFGEKDEGLDSGRGFFRFFIDTKEHLPFLMFFFLALYNKTKKIIFVILTLVIYAAVILHVGRQFMFWSGLLALAYYMYTNGKNIWKWGLLIILVSVFLNWMLENFTVITDIIELSKNTSTDNSADMDNIRFKAMEYFVNNYNTNPLTILFGSGFATEGSQIYHKIAQCENKGYYLTDVGFVGMYCNTGIVSVILYLILFYKVLFKCKVEPQYLYMKFYIAYILLLYLGSHALTSNLIFVVFAVYILKHNSVYLKTN